jgi:hypothetical protein
MDSPATSSVLLNANGTFNKNLPNNQRRNAHHSTLRKLPPPLRLPQKASAPPGPVNFSAASRSWLVSLPALCGFIQKNGLPVVYLAFEWRVARA